MLSQWGQISTGLYARPGQECWSEERCVPGVKEGAGGALPAPPANLQEAEE